MGRSDRRRRHPAGLPFPKQRRKRSGPRHDGRPQRLSAVHTNHRQRPCFSLPRVSQDQRLDPLRLGPKDLRASPQKPAEHRPAATHLPLPRLHNPLIRLITENNRPQTQQIADRRDDRRLRRPHPRTAVEAHRLHPDSQPVGQQLSDLYRTGK
jgi:hypothetical protein